MVPSSQFETRLNWNVCFSDKTLVGFLNILATQKRGPMRNPTLNTNSSSGTKVVSSDEILSWPILELRTLASQLDLDLRRHLFARLKDKRGEILRELGVSESQVTAFSCDASAEAQDRLLVKHAHELTRIGILRLSMPSSDVTS